MALPTLAEVRAVIVPWWRAPGRPRIAELRARLAKIVTDPRCSVTCELAGNPPTLTITVTQYSEDGVPGASVSRAWTHTDDAGGRAGATLDDVCDDFTGKLTRRQHRGG